MERIESLQISNYKSINKLNLECSRINVLIGEPNVGKSNILEALDLTYLSSFFNLNERLQKTRYKPTNIDEYFRVTKVSELFHLGDVSKPISIVHPGFSYDISLAYNNQDDRNIFEWIKSDGQRTSFNNDFEIVEPIQYYGSPIKPYRYKENVDSHDVGNYINILMPPYGNNLVEVIKHNPNFRDFIGELIKDLGFELNIDTSSNEILFQLRLSKGLVYTVRYEAMADTLKRVIFYIAAIRYNNAHVITLEEPEVHSFPKFISFLADELIKTSGRQFFVATHSPYLLNALIENTPMDELAVFLCGYDKIKFETTVKRLSQDELSELLNYGVDIFFNINRYLDDRVEYNS
jgi:AAA15 family ATPase/GTPase